MLDHSKNVSKIQKNRKLHFYVWLYCAKYEKNRGDICQNVRNIFFNSRVVAEKLIRKVIVVKLMNFMTKANKSLSVTLMGYLGIVDERKRALKMRLM